jgi:hypothetical protein
MNLCQYRNMFGKVREGVHAYRICDIAIVDVIATFILAKLISFLSTWSYYDIVICLFLLAILVHRLFCVNTAVNVMIFGQLK